MSYAHGYDDYLHDGCGPIRMADSWMELGVDHSLKLGNRMSLALAGTYDYCLSDNL